MARSTIQSKVLLVEGKDEVNFFNALLKHLGMGDITVEDVGGKDNFPAKLRAFLLGFGTQIQAYAIIRDADRSANAAFQSVVDLLKNEREPYPDQIGGYGENPTRRVGIFIMPGNQDEGMLEDLCLHTVSAHPAMTCTDQYFSCLEAAIPLDQSKEPGRRYFPKNLSKARALAFLAGQEETVASVGLVAQKGYWNLDYPSLGELKAFLVGL
jgi:hypothetical protein